MTRAQWTQRATIPVYPYPAAGTAVPRVDDPVPDEGRAGDRADPLADRAATGGSWGRSSSTCTCSPRNGKLARRLVHARRDVRADRQAAASCRRRATSRRTRAPDLQPGRQGQADEPVRRSAPSSSVIPFAVVLARSCWPGSPPGASREWFRARRLAHARCPHRSPLSMPRMALELGRVTDRKPPFKFSSLTRVGFSDTDAQGIVYYGRYLPYFDAARVEYHRHLDMLHDGLRGRPRACAPSNIEYHAPGAVRRPARGLHPRRADRADERDLRDGGLPGRRRRPDGDGAPDARPRRPRGAQGVPDSGRRSASGSAPSKATTSSSDGSGRGRGRRRKLELRRPGTRPLR